MYQETPEQRKQRLNAMAQMYHQGQNPQMGQMLGGRMTNQETRMVNQMPYPSMTQDQLDQARQAAMRMQQPYLKGRMTDRENAMVQGMAQRTPQPPGFLDDMQKMMAMRGY